MKTIRKKVEEYIDYPECPECPECGEAMEPYGIDAREQNTIYKLFGFVIWTSRKVTPVDLIACRECGYKTEIEPWDYPITYIIVDKPARKETNEES